MGLALGFKPELISIIPTGFTIKFKSECTNYNVKIKNGNLLSIKKAIIALAGPLTNAIIILIAIIYYNLTKNVQILNIPIELIIYSNALIFIFNLIPIYPLDGGRILSEIIHIFCGLYQSYIITNKISNIIVIILTIISSIAILVYKNLAILVIIVYLWVLVINENKKISTKLKIWDKIRK